MTIASILNKTLWALGGLALLCGPASARIPRIPTGPEVLRRVLMQEDRVPFEARQSVVLSSGRQARATITQEVHLAPGKGRVTYLMPKSAAGREVVLDGAWRWEYNPAAHLAIRTGLLHKPVTPQSVHPIIEHLERAYRLHVDPNITRLGGRPAYVLHIDPLHQDRARRVWWVDKSTGLVLRREVYDADGSLDSVSSYININFHPPHQPALFQFTPPKGVRVVTRTEPHVVQTIEQAHRLAPAWGRVPTTLGRGFDFENARLVRVKGILSLHLNYSDGLIDLSLIEIPGKNAVAHNGRRARVVRVDGASASLTQVAPFRVLSWNRTGKTFTLVADLAEHTLLDIANAIQ